MVRSVVFASLVLWSLTVKATTFELPDNGVTVVGHNLVVFSRQEDTLLDIGRQFNLGYGDIVNANPDVDPWLPGQGTRVVVPTQFILPDVPRNGIVVNLAELRLYYYLKPDEHGVQQLITHPLGIGREGWATPLGLTRIIQKTKNPTWTPPASILAEHLEKGDPLPKVVPAGPDNPLGAYKMRLAMPGYLLHGTNKPYGVGLRVSHGCIRLFPEDIEPLFYNVAINTPVNIIYQKDKAALYGGNLYLESHEAQDDIDDRKNNAITPMVNAITELQIREFELDIDDLVFIETLVSEHKGIVTQFNRTGSDIIEDVWFIHAGLGQNIKSLLGDALAGLDLDLYFWPLQPTAASEEALLGPFESYEQAKQMADKISDLIDLPVWVALMSSNVI